MRLIRSIPLSAFALLAASLLPTSAAEPSAEQILRQMSDKLAAARSFTFTARREIDPALIENTAAAESALVEASVLRPNKLVAHARTNLGVRHFYADGRTLSLLDEKANTYATLPMRTNIDGVVAALDEKYGFTPPLAEFAVSNPYRGIREQAQHVSYLGRDKVSACFLGLGGVECHHLALEGQVADAELWIAVGDSLPRKLVATFHRPGHPQVRVAFSHWNLAAQVSASDFVFTPPKGAERIELWTPARMAAASQKLPARKN